MPNKRASIIVDEISRAIIRGELRDGDRLPCEEELKATHMVSRPTLREALRVLEAAGLIEVIRGARGGARVKSPSAEGVGRAMGAALQFREASIGDLAIMLTLIEPSLVRAIAEQRGPVAARALAERVRRDGIPADDLRSLIAATTSFHFDLVDLFENKALAILSEGLRLVVKRAVQEADWPSRLGREVTDAYRESVRYRARITKLMSAWDGEAAAEMWREYAASSKLAALIALLSAVPIRAVQ